MVELLTAEGVKVLDNGKSILERDGDTITLLGLADKRVNPHYDKILEMMCKGHEDDFKLLLCHRPELFADYVENVSVYVRMERLLSRNVHVQKHVV